MILEIPLIKIDVERRLVIGVAALEQTDKSKEKMDYATAKPAFEKWSNEMSAATNGLSKGNLRVMHTKTVAGKIDQLVFNDDAKQVEVCAKILDDNEWQKVLGGCYSGFSIGGGYAKKWADPDEAGVTKYTPRIVELSLVDNPCMPGARFAELVKADGMVEQIELHGRPPATFADMWKIAPPATEILRGRTFGQMFQERPMTFGDLMKLEPVRYHPVFVPMGNQASNATPTQKGAGVGAVAGALAGGARHGVVGAVVGGIGGALAGAGIGKAVSKFCPTCGQKNPKTP